jgi:hypothetical protein
LTANLLNSTPQISVLNLISQGTSESTRIGDKARMRHLALKMYFGSASSLTVPTSVQVMIVREKTTLGSALSPSQFFDSATPSPVAWQRNVLTRDPDRFITLYDSKFKVLGLAEFSNTTLNKDFSTPSICQFEVDLPLDFVTDYSRGNAGTVSDIDTNGLNLVVFTSNTTASAVFATYSYTLTYTDV